jgi:hypothetical protein
MNKGVNKLAVGLAALALGAPALAQQARVSQAEGHATSAPVWSMPVWHGGQGNFREAPEPKRLFGHQDGVAPGQKDPAVPSAPISPSVALSNPALSFDGVGIPSYSVQYAPPDTNGAAGSTQYVQWVNVAFAVFDKTSGARLSGPTLGNSLFSALGGPCAQYNDGDPIAQWDKVNKRWILTQFAVSQGSRAGYMQCVAVSTTEDATGAYNLYSYNYGSLFNDYPKLGVGVDGNYYITFNMFKGNRFNGADLCAYEGAAMRAGTAARQSCYQLGSSFGGVLPADIDGPVVNSATPEQFVNFGTNSLNFWTFTPNFGTGGTVTGPVNVSVAAFSKACSGGTCIPQTGTSNQLDSLADRLMYRFAHRQYASYDGYVVTHSVANGSVASSVRWYEIRKAGSATPTIQQQGTLASTDGISRWMGSAAMDKNGNIVVGYSRSSSSLKADIVYTAHTPTDPSGSMPNGEVSLVTGGGAQTGTLHRWGDYSSMSVDPTDDCTMWYTTEYLQSSGSFNWSTRIGKIKPPSCP